MKHIQYGSNWIASEQQRSDSRKPRLIVDKKTEKRINTEIRILQNQRETLYNDDNLSDEELDRQCKEITAKIHQLIDSMYETKEQVKRRLYK